MDCGPEIRVFVSYSHKDQKWLDALLTSLKPFERDSPITFKAWSDRDIQPGQVWRDEIQTVLTESSIAVLLVSQNFLASDFIARKELQPLLALAETNGLQILWIAVSSSTVMDTAIAAYQALNDPERPLDSLSKPQRNRELARMAKQIYLIACRQARNKAPRLESKGTKSNKSVSAAPSSRGRRLQHGDRNKGSFRKNNFDAFPELKGYINKNHIRTATLIQMSCLNEMHVVRELWRTNAKIDIFISSANARFGVSMWQRSRVRRFLGELRNELENISDPGDSVEMKIYRYDAPASVRAILINDNILTSGLYLYQMRNPDGHGKVLDVRGGELPLLLLKKQHPDFETARGMILRLIDNWKREGVAKLFRTYRPSDFLRSNR